jgi:hypothetical protein
MVIFHVAQCAANSAADRDRSLQQGGDSLHDGRRVLDSFATLKEIAMSKGMNQKKEQKRKPAKTLEEKRAAKRAKREERAAGRPL